MDVGNPEQKTLTIFIKTPSQAHEDLTVEGVSLNWTVKDLKAHLSTVYPSRPVSFDGADMLTVLAEVVSSCDRQGGSRLHCWNVVMRASCRPTAGGH